jgi:hypothetical protein
VEQDAEAGGTVGCSALVSYAGSTMLQFDYRDWPDQENAAWHWTVDDPVRGREWRPGGGGYGGGIDPDGRCDGGGGCEFDGAPRTGAVLRLCGFANGDLVFDHSLECRPAPVEPLEVAVVEVSARPLADSLRLTAALRELGWRRRRAVADWVVATDASPVEVMGQELRVVAEERWGHVRRLTIRIDGGHTEPVPQWWVLDIDGARYPAITDGLQSATGGEIGHLTLLG